MRRRADISFSPLLTLCLRRCRLEVFATEVPKRKSSLGKCASGELLAILFLDVVFRDLLYLFFFFFLKILRKIFILCRGPYECRSRRRQKIAAEDHRRSQTLCRQINYSRTYSCFTYAGTFVSYVTQKRKFNRNISAKRDANNGGRLTAVARLVISFASTTCRERERDSSIQCT